jgi:hypothetical protein
MANKKYNNGTRQTLLTSLEGRLDMSMPRSASKSKDCGCKKKMNMGGTVPTANTYFGKK